MLDYNIKQIFEIDFPNISIRLFWSIKTQVVWLRDNTWVEIWAYYELLYQNRMPGGIRWHDTYTGQCYICLADCFIICMDIWFQWRNKKQYTCMKFKRWVISTCYEKTVVLTSFSFQHSKIPTGFIRIIFIKCIIVKSQDFPWHYLTLLRCKDDTI